jgi:three-Cys-motif partner protein
MSKGMIPSNYIGREQAFIKHTMLAAYLKRLFMIVGQKRYDVINYVDCFAGPWEDETDDLSGSSIGIALREAISCMDELNKFRKGSKVRFRILYNEKQPDAFKRLQAFVNKHQNHDGITVECINGDFTQQIESIKSWAGHYFTFFFIDPKGWKRVIGGKTLAPLLELRNTEFLINVMYDFFNRIIEVGQWQEDIDELLGQRLSFDDTDTPDSRRQKVINCYMNNTDMYYDGRVVNIPVLRPDKDRVLYFLVYLTRHPKGIEVFKEEAEKLDWVQRVTRNEVRLRKQLEAQKTLSLFAEEDIYSENINMTDAKDNREAAKAYLLEVMALGPLKIDMNKWAYMLETTDFFPIDFKLAMGELVKEGRVENLSANVSRRRKHFIKPDKRETWVLCDQ